MNDRVIYYYNNEITNSRGIKHDAVIILKNMDPPKDGLCYLVYKSDNDINYVICSINKLKPKTMLVILTRSAKSIFKHMVLNIHPNVTKLIGSYNVLIYKKYMLCSMKRICVCNDPIYYIPQNAASVKRIKIRNINGKFVESGCTCGRIFECLTHPIPNSVQILFSSSYLTDQDYNALRHSNIYFISYTYPKQIPKLNHNHIRCELSVHFNPPPNILFVKFTRKSKIIEIRNGYERLRSWLKKTFIVLKLANFNRFIIINVIYNQLYPWLTFMWKNDKYVFIVTTPNNEHIEIIF